MIRARDVIKAKEQVIKLFENRLATLNNELDGAAFVCRNIKKQLESIKDSKSEEYKNAAYQLVQADLDFRCLKELYTKMLDAFNNCISRKGYDTDCYKGYACSYDVDDEDYY